MEEKNGIELPINGEASEQVANANSPSPGNSAGEPSLQGAEGDMAANFPGLPEQPADLNQSGQQGQSAILGQDEIDRAMRQEARERQSPLGSAGSPIPSIKRADFQQLSGTSEKNVARNMELLMDVELPVSIELGRTRMHISDILSLSPGSIVELDKLVGEPVDLLVNQKRVAQGEVVVVEESFGLRITQLVSPEERLNNLK